MIPTPSLTVLVNHITKTLTVPMINEQTYQDKIDPDKPLELQAINLVQFVLDDIGIGRVVTGVTWSQADRLVVLF